MNIKTNVISMANSPIREDLRVFRSCVSTSRIVFLVIAQAHGQNEETEQFTQLEMLQRLKDINYSSLISSCTIIVGTKDHSQRF